MVEKWIKYDRRLDSREQKDRTREKERERVLERDGELGLSREHGKCFAAGSPTGRDGAHHWTRGGQRGTRGRGSVPSRGSLVGHGAARKRAVAAKGGRPGGRPAAPAQYPRSKRLVCTLCVRSSCAKSTVQNPFLTDTSVPQTQRASRCGTRRLSMDLWHNSNSEIPKVDPEVFPVQTRIVANWMCEFGLCRWLLLWWDCANVVSERRNSWRVPTSCDAVVAGFPREAMRPTAAYVLFLAHLIQVWVKHNPSSHFLPAPGARFVC